MAQIGLNLPGEAFHDWLNPVSPLAGALPALGKMLGGALDLATGLPNEELRGHYASEYAAKAKYFPPKPIKSKSEFYRDAAGHLSEAPQPDGDYGGVVGSDIGSDDEKNPATLFQNPGVAARMQGGDMAGMKQAEAADAYEHDHPPGVACNDGH